MDPDEGLTYARSVPATGPTCFFRPGAPLAEYQGRVPHSRHGGGRPHVWPGR